MCTLARLNLEAVISAVKHCWRSLCSSTCGGGWMVVTVDEFSWNCTKWRGDHVDDRHIIWWSWSQFCWLGGIYCEVVRIEQQTWWIDCFIPVYSGLSSVVVVVSGDDCVRWTDWSPYIWYKMAIILWSTLARWGTSRSVVMIKLRHEYETFYSGVENKIYMKLWPPSLVGWFFLLYFPRTVYGLWVLAEIMD